MATRTRMSPEARREHLLDLGAQLFAELPYEEVHIEQVALQAGVSRGLLYYYFPNKRAFLAALLERASRALDDATQSDPQLSPLEQLEHGVDLYLEWSKRNQHLSRTVHRGAASADPQVLAVQAASTTRTVEQIMSSIVPGTPHPLLEMAVRSWMLFVRAACQEWLDHPRIARKDVRQLCIATLLGALRSLPDRALPPEARAALSAP